MMCCNVQNVIMALIDEEVSLGLLLKYNLRTVQSYSLNEESQFFWECIRPLWTGVFLDHGKT
jgi:hypothetical protein